MKKFLSTVVTLTLVFAMVLSSTVTVEAKSSKTKTTKSQTTKTQSKGLTSGNALLDEFISVCLASSGLTIGGKSYTAKEVNALYLTNNSSLTSIKGYEDSYSHEGFYIKADNEYIPAGFVKCYESDKYTPSLYSMDNAYNDGIKCGSEIARNGVFFTDEMINKGINSVNLATWMQARGITTTKGLIDYFASNGVTLPDYSSHVQFEQQIMAEYANSDDYGCSKNWGYVSSGDYSISIDEWCNMNKIYGQEKNYANQWSISINHYNEANPDKYIYITISTNPQNDYTNKYMYETTSFSISSN